MSYLTYSIFSYFYVSVYKVATTAALAKYTSLIIYIFGAQTTNLSTIYTVSIRYSLTYIQYFILCFIFIRIMADQQDRGLLGMFGKKHEEGSHGQPAPYTEQGGYKYGETELHHSSPQDYTYDATQVHHAPPTATYSEDMYGISKPHDKQGEEKSHGLFGKLHDKHDSSSSSSSDEEEKGGGRRKKKGLKEKIKEKLPGHHGTGNEEGEKYVGEEKKHGLFGH